MGSIPLQAIKILVLGFMKSFRNKAQYKPKICTQ
jgi:hypothetical protein